MKPLTVKQQEAVRVFARQARDLLSKNGRCVETASTIMQAADKLLNAISERGREDDPTRTGLIEARTAAYFLCLYYMHPGELLTDEHWSELETVLPELEGEVPSQSLARDRAQWIWHWRSLWPRANETLRADILKTAKKRYPDMDLSEISEEV